MMSWKNGTTKHKNRKRKTMSKTEYNDKDYVNYCVSLAKMNCRKEYDGQRNCWLIMFNNFGNVIDVDDVRKPELVFENCSYWKFDDEDKADDFLNQKRVQLAIFNVTGKELDLSSVKQFYYDNAHVNWRYQSTLLPQIEWYDVAKKYIDCERKNNE